MKASDIPSKIPLPWATNAGGSFVRDIPETTTTPGAASFDQGFPPLTFSPIGAGGEPPSGSDFNGIYRQITQWLRWQAAGSPISYDADFSTAVGGYPKGALLNSSSTPGTIWQNQVDDNTTNPDAGGSNWIPVGTAVGTVSDFAGATAPGGWLLCFGQAVSRTTYATLFAVIGTTWGSGDGSTTFNVPDLRGRVTAGVDAMGGTPANRLTSTTIPGGAILGKAGGEQTHVLTITELASHTHTAAANVNDPGHFHTIPMTGGVGGTQNPQNGNGTSTTKQTNDAITNITVTVANDNTGGDGAHNNVQPTAVMNKIIKF